MTGLTAEEKIIKAVIRLQKEKPFWAYLMLHLNKTKMSDKMKAQMIASGITPTMAVDMKGNLYFADEFVDSLSQEELKGVIAHEVIHLAFTHLARLGQRDMKIWNVACDLVANDMLITDGFTLPKGCLNPTHDHTFKFANCEIKDIHDKSAEIIYNEFPRNPKGSKGSGKGKGGKGSGESDDELKNFDQHIFGDGSGKDGMGKGKGKKLSQAQVDRIKKNWEKKLTEAVTFAKQRGVLPAGMERRLDELLNSKVSWKEKLYKYITNQIPHDYTWCLEKNTLIRTTKGLKRIKDIQIGESVLGTKDNKTTTPTQVIDTAKRRKKLKYVIVTKKGRVLTCSGEHQILTNKGYVQACNLEINDKLKCEGKRLRK